MTMAVTLWYKCWFEVLCGEPARILRQAETLVGLCREHGLSFYLTGGTFLLGWAQWHGDEREAGIAAMREGVVSARNLHLSVCRTFMETLLAEAEAEMGRVEAGLARLEEQLAEDQRTGQRSTEPEMHRIRGRILLQEPADHAAAETSFIRAIEVARSQQTRSFELRATLALAKLYHATGRDKMVPELLAPALVYFNKQVELPEFAEAHRLLASIRAG